MQNNKDAEIIDIKEIKEINIDDSESELYTEEEKYHIAIIGATSAIAKQCARIWAARNPAKITLIGRNTNKLKEIAVELKAISRKTKIIILEQGNIIDPVEIDTLINKICETKIPDIALIAQGFMPEQRECQQDLSQTKEAIEITGLSPVLYTEAISNKMREINKGTIGIISSVAGDKGRASNYIYGSSKSLLSQYVTGLQHELALNQSNVAPVLILPARVDTPMTARFKARGEKMAAVEDIAKGIIDAIDEEKLVAYLPAKWSIIMWLVRNIPRSIFNRFDV